MSELRNEFPGTGKTSDYCDTRKASESLGGIVAGASDFGLLWLNRRVEYNTRLDPSSVESSTSDRRVLSLV